MITIQIRDNYRMHGYMLCPWWLGRFFFFLNAVPPAQQTLPRLPVTALWVLPRRSVGEGNKIKAVCDSPSLPEAAAIRHSHRLYFYILQIPPQTGYLWEPKEKPWKHWLALTVLYKQDKPTFLGDCRGKKGRSFLSVPCCHLERRHKEERVGDLAGIEGRWCLCLPNFIWSKSSPESPALWPPHVPAHLPACLWARSGD